MDARRLARTFPLVPRPRPPCTPLADRVRALGDLADAAERATGADAAAKAAAVHNLAALIASDCGRPDVARDLCRRQAAGLLCAPTLGAQQARHALEPLVNLARLLIRDGDGDAAYRLLDKLARAVRDRTELVVDDRHLAFRTLAATDRDHQEVCRWLWTVLLADGTRALVTAERWTDALAHVQQHKGIGHRLLDGRQIAVLAALFNHGPKAARTALAAATPKELWEHTVAACLTALFSTTASSQERNVSGTPMATMVDRYLKLPATAGLVVFRTRVGTTAMELAAQASHHDCAMKAAERLAVEALSDGYAARDLLSSPTTRRYLPAEQVQSLTHVKHAAGFGCDSLTEPLRAELMAAVARACIWL